MFTSDKNPTQFFIGKMILLDQLQKYRIKSPSPPLAGPMAPFFDRLSPF